VTVMLDSWFGVHPQVVRSKLLKQLKPSEILLYLYLMERSEFLCNRVIRARDCDITEAVGLSSRAARNARIKLQECGLIRCVRGPGNVYIYTICDPRTKQPYPGDSDKPMVPPKRGYSDPIQSSSADAQRPRDQPKEPSNTSPQSHGIPLKFP